MTSSNINSDPNQGEEIDILALLKIWWERKRFVTWTLIIFTAMGLFVAIFTENEFSAKTTIVPQSADSQRNLGSGLGGLAALAGINLNGGVGSDINIELYPKIIASIPFQKAMMETPLDVVGYEQPITFSDYYLKYKKSSILSTIKKFTLKLPQTIVVAIKGESSDLEGSSSSIISNDLYTLTRREKNLMKLISSQLSIDVDEKKGFIVISSRMPEPKMAAQMVDRAQNLLQEAIIEFKIHKAKNQLDFIEERLFEKQQEFSQAENDLAKFRDRNRNISTATAQFELQRLQSAYDLLFGINLELSKQYEAQKIQVEADTPIFSIIEPVFVPIEKSAPGRLKILLIWIIMGGVLSVLWIYGKLYYSRMAQRWVKL